MFDGMGILTILPASMSVPCSSVWMVILFARRGRSLNTTLNAADHADRTSCNSGASVFAGAWMTLGSYAALPKQPILELDRLPAGSVAEPRRHQPDLRADPDDDAGMTDAGFFSSFAFVDSLSLFVGAFRLVGSDDGDGADSLPPCLKMRK